MTYVNGYTPAAVDELLDMIEDLVEQGCTSLAGEIHHHFISAYEDALDLLVRYRSGRWQATERGAKRLTSLPSPAIHRATRHP